MNKQLTVHPSHVAVAKKYSTMLLIGPHVNDEFIRLVQHLYTPEEAEIATHLPLYVPSHFKTIARRAGKPADETKRMLETMNGKRVVYRYKDRYSLISLIPGMFEYILMQGNDSPWHKEFAEHFRKFFKSGFFRKYTDTNIKVPAARYVPVNTGVENSNKIVDYDFMMDVVDQHSVLAVMYNCQCRQEHHLLGHVCELDGRNDGCMLFGRYARWGVEGGYSRYVTKDEMRSIIQDRKKRNFAFMALNFSPKHDLMICSCCKCCCHLLDAVNNFGAMIAIAPPMYIVEFNESLCKHNGACVRVCPSNAHSDGDSKHVLDESKCIGCGVCADNCPHGALKMVKNPYYKAPYRNIAELGVRLLPRIIRMSIKIRGQAGRAAKR